MRNITKIFPGGLLETFGRGFGHDVKMFVYPANKVETGETFMLKEIFQYQQNLVGFPSGT